MAEQLGVGAPEREGTRPTSGDDTVPPRSRTSPAAAGNGSAPAAAAEPVEAEPAERGPEVDPDPRTDGASRTPARARGDERSAAVERHPSMAQRLGLRPKGRLRARKVQRIVRRVDPWSVLKLSLIFYFCVWVMVIVAAVLLWGVAVGSGTIGSLESFIAEFLAFEEFRFNGDQLFQLFALGGLIGVFVATAVTAVLAVLFNLIADLTGGIRFTVVEEESARRVLDRR